MTYAIYEVVLIMSQPTLYMTKALVYYSSNERDQT